MKLPYSWIKEYLSLSEPPDSIAKRLTMAGIEVDNILKIGSNCQGVVVGKVLDAEQHPNADKLKVAKVTDGKEVYQVVCGASNCRAGLKTAFAREGAVLMDEKGQSFQIKRSKLRGVESCGMLCSGAELGVSEEAEGIIELPEHLIEGTSISELFSDSVFEISLTPNLGHCNSLIGIVRELAAATELSIHSPSVIVNETPENRIEKAIQVVIENETECPRYTCRLIKNVKVGPSPHWLKQRLEQCGLRSVNNVVDVTNYVLLELGHPLHAFDYDRINDHRIIVRKAKEGEKFTSLDGKNRSLNPADLLICDAKGPIAIAGVIGGEESEVKLETTHVLLESAYFDPVAIRKTSKRLGCQTDASKRFERGTDPNGLKHALDRATMLLQQVAGGEVVAGILDVKKRDFPEKVISCRLSRINQLLGTSLSASEVENIFHRLFFSYTFDGKNIFTAKIPSFRVDIQSEIDLVEEVARLFGYDNIPRKPCLYKDSQLPHNPIYLFEREVHARLIAEGLQQFLTCDLIGPALLHRIDANIPAESIQVLNPTSVEQSILRTSLLPGLLQVVKYNWDHQNANIAGYEVGNIHFRKEEHFYETPVFGIILTGKERPYHWDPKPQEFDFYDLKGVVENVLKGLGVHDLEFKNLKLPLFHTGRQASVFVNSIEIGSMGEIHPAIQHRLDVPQRIYFAEFSLQDIIKVAKSAKIQNLPLFPGSERDWTLTLKEAASFDSLMKIVHSVPSTLLESVTLKDIYRSEKLGNELKNITLHFFYRDLTKTMEQEKVDAEHQRIITEINQKLKLQELIL